MKKKLLLLIPLLIAQSPLWAEETSPSSSTPTDPPAEADPAAIKTNSSYAFGYNNGRSFQKQMNRFGLLQEDINREEFIKGFMDVLDGNHPVNGLEALNAAMLGLHNKVQEREKTIAEENLRESEAFLAENKKREGVITTDSGLQYEIITPGDGVPHSASQEVRFKVKYKGTFIDGSEFDASPKDSAVTMSLSVVPGLREALIAMTKGAKWKLFVDPKLGYGQNRRSENLGPNSTLIFEVELLDIHEPPAKASAVSPPIPVPAAPKTK